MKKYLILFALISTVFNSAFTQGNFVEPLVSKNKFSYPLPTYKLNPISISQFGISHPSMYSGKLGNAVSGIKGNEYIVFCDLYNGQINYQFSLDSFFNNSISSRYSGEIILGFSIKNDTVLLMMQDQIIVASIDISGLQLIQQFGINNESHSDWFQDWTLDATCSFEPLLINDKINLCRLSYHFAAYEPAFYEQPHTLEFSLNGAINNGLTLPVSFCQNYKSGYHGLLLQPQRVYNIKSGEITFGYQGDAEMQQYNPLTGNIRLQNVRSYYQQANIPYVVVGTEKGVEDNFSNIIQNDQYTHLIYDPYHNGYYRFFRKGLGNIPITDTKMMFTRPLVIMILDSALNTIDEVMFPEPNYLEQNSFAGPEGLYLSFQNWNGGSRKSASYDILNWPEKKQIISELNTLLPVIIGSELSFPKNSLKDGPFIITIYNSIGKLILRSDFNENTVLLPELSSGAYFGILSNRTWSGSFKFIKN